MGGVREPCLVWQVDFVSRYECHKLATIGNRYFQGWSAKMARERVACGERVCCSAADSVGAGSQAVFVGATRRPEPTVLVAVGRPVAREGTAPRQSDVPSRALRYSRNGHFSGTYLARAQPLEYLRRKYLCELDMRIRRT